jgi:hypothetical protein
LKLFLIESHERQHAKEAVSRLQEGLKYESRLFWNSFATKDQTEALAAQISLRRIISRVGASWEITMCIRGEGDVFSFLLFAVSYHTLEIPERERERERKYIDSFKPVGPSSLVLQ